MPIVPDGFESTQEQQRLLEQQKLLVAARNKPQQSIYLSSVNNHQLPSSSSSSSYTGQQQQQNILQLPPKGIYFQKNNHQFMNTNRHQQHIIQKLSGKRQLKSTYSNRLKSEQFGGLLTSTQYKRTLNDNSSDEDDFHQTKQSKSMERVLNKLPQNIYVKYNEQIGEILVPIRLDLEVKPGLVLKDMFTWNVADYTMSPKRYAEILVFDLDLPQTFVNTIAKTIQTQIEFYTGAALASACIEEGQEFIPIQIEIQVGRRLIRDKLIWDLSESNSTTPEDYARIFAQDHGLGGENVALIASTIREQILLFQQQQQHQVRNSSESESLGISKKNMLSRTLVLDELTPEQLNQVASKHDRQSRRMRRETARVKQRRYTTMF